MSKRATIADQILGLLSEGDRWANEIVAGVSAQPASIRVCLWQLVKKGEIVRVKRGIYRKKEVLEERGAVKNSRKNSDNVETINKLLRISELCLDDLWVGWEQMSGSKMTISQLNAFVAEFKTLAFAIDKLMHRWYIVHRGYDANPYQAQADVDRKVSAANASGEQPEEESQYELISWESEKETLAEAIARHEKKKKKGFP